MDRALRHPARDPALRQPRRRPLRPAPRHQVHDPGRVGRLRRGRAALARHAPTRATTSRPSTSIMAVGCLSTSKMPEIPGVEEFQGNWYHTGSLAPRGRRLHRAAGRRHRHRVLGDPVDPDHRRAGGAPDRVPADAELQPAGEERPARPADESPSSRRATRSTARRHARAASACPTRRRRSRRSRSTEEEREAPLPGRLRGREPRRDAARLQRPDHGQGGQRHGRRVRAVSGSARSSPTPRSPRRCARTTTRSAPSGRASTPTTTPRTTGRT